MSSHEFFIVAHSKPDEIRPYHVAPRPPTINPEFRHVSIFNILTHETSPPLSSLLEEPTVYNNHLGKTWDLEETGVGRETER